MADEPPGYFKISQFLDHFPMSRSTLYRLVQQGVLTIIKVGRSSFLSKAEVAQWEADLPTLGANDNIKR
jgi:excisionase family DNA binding protein